MKEEAEILKTLQALVVKIGELSATKSQPPPPLFNQEKIVTTVIASVAVVVIISVASAFFTSSSVNKDQDKAIEAVDRRLTEHKDDVKTFSNQNVRDINFNFKNVREGKTTFILLREQKP